MPTHRHHAAAAGVGARTLASDRPGPGSWCQCTHHVALAMFLKLSEPQFLQLKNADSQSPLVFVTAPR